MNACFRYDTHDNDNHLAWWILENNEFNLMIMYVFFCNQSCTKCN